MARHIPVETSLGFLRGRDCIYLDHVVSDEAAGTLTLDGEINGHLCSGAHSDDFIPYLLRFTGVVTHKQIDLDSSDWDWESCFDEITESEWLRSLGSRVTSRHRHFMVQTYDDVFEIVCESYDFQIREIAA